MKRIKFDTWLGHLGHRGFRGRFDHRIKSWYDNKYPLVEPEWDIHWYAHIVNPAYDLISVDHTGIVQTWVAADRLHLGEKVRYASSENDYCPDGRYVRGILPFEGTVVDVIHSADGSGGTILVYSDTILVKGDIDDEMTLLSDYVTDDIYREIVGQRELILAGELFPRNRVTYSLSLKGRQSSDLIADAWSDAYEDDLDRRYDEYIINKEESK